MSIASNYADCNQKTRRFDALTSQRCVDSNLRGFSDLKGNMAGALGGHLILTHFNSKNYCITSSYSFE